MKNIDAKIAKMKTFREHLAEMFQKRPGFKEAYDATEVELVYHKTFIEARVKKNLTQKNLADRLGIAQSALARFESGRANPTFSTLQKFLKSLSLKIKIVPA
jgi:ribosome-binding protein aMBF1 (putative translation factor)